MLDAFYLLASVLLLPLWICQIATGSKSLTLLWHRVIGVAPLPDDGRPVLWFHASSIGEVLLLGPLLKHFGQQPLKHRLVLSTETVGGLQAAKAVFAGDLLVIHVPLDLSWCVRRAYAAIRPRLLVLSELELWPNLLLEAKRRGIPVAVVNSRMNDADFRFFQRINRWHRPALAAIAWWGAQTLRDAERIRRLLGQSRTTVEVTGSLKFEALAGASAANASQKMRHLLGFSAYDRTLVAGSTHPPEEQILLDAFRRLARQHPELRLVLVPRDSRRFPKVAEMLRHSGIPFAQRSRLIAPLERSEPVTLIDSIGELPAFWQLADFGFVGGSLAPHCGGQNVLEPAALGKPICFGPNVWNFSEASAGLLQAQAARRVHSPTEIAQTVEEWLNDPDLAKQMGENGAAYVQSQRGAAAATIRALDESLAAGGPDREPKSPRIE
jgi:3-deoxy-D-manno-octulosonic-acid transferase